MEKKITYTENDRAIVDALKGTDGLTLADINEKTGLNIVAGHIVSAMRKGLIAPIGEREVIKPAVKTVSTYIFVSGDVMNRENGKPYDYNETALAILKCAAGFEDRAFTLAELSQCFGSELKSGHISHLVKKGNLAKGEDREMPTTKKSVVKVYGFVNDIPND